MPLDDISARARDIPEIPSKLKNALFATRRLSAAIAAPLSAEDQTVQASDDASPTKWHLAHTSWFFEELALKPFLQGYAPFDERFSYCFNSYYESLGARHPRPKRGLLTRPSVSEVAAYRRHIDENLERLLGLDPPQEALRLIEIGVHHEQQHQELMLTDILALFAANPLKPVYRDGSARSENEGGGEGAWLSFPGGPREIGHGGDGFAYDNEGPPHRVFLRDFRLFSRPVTNGEWLAFMESGGYAEPSLWLSDGWACKEREGWTAPGYWEKQGGGWRQMTLHGLLPVDPIRPVTHVSYYEADAFARWSGNRLPTEFEWETASLGGSEADCALDLDRLLPSPAQGEALANMFGCVWQWTQSAYAPYPGYKPAPGPLGEYNGKFMCNQLVLRGGSFATPSGHVRPTYRNFFYPHQRWQFMGLRLASDV